MSRASRVLGRRVVPALRSPSLAQRSPTFSLSAQHRSEKTPSLADISGNHAAEFDAKQKEFRALLSAAKVKADSQSSLSTSPASSLAASASQHFVGQSSNKEALSSHSLNTEEAREAARAKVENGSSDKKQGALSNLIYGTEAGRAMDHEIERSFSQVLARGKYVHSIVFHEVKPDKVDEYVELVGGWYPKVAANPENKVNLVGSWRTEVGDCDTFVHIWEYQRYHGYHDSLHSIQRGREFIDFDHHLKSLINSKRTSLMQEFSFWPTTPPRKLGGVFELRSYELHPGNLLEWETHWRKGLKARREVMEGVGAWFVQIGDLNTVHHLWQYPDLEERRVRREKSWGIEGWGDTVHRTVPLIQTMKSRILIPMEWSPVA